MANYTNVSKAKHATLVAATVDSVTFSKRYDWVEVVNRGTVELTFVVDAGADPTVAADGAEVVPAGASVIVPSSGDAATNVRLISSGTPAYSVYGRVVPDERTGGGSSGGGGGGAVTVADGADVAEGSTTDAAVVTNTTGTVSGKLRGLVKLIIDLIAKTPAIGTAGTASIDVITVQGITSGTPQPVSLGGDEDHIGEVGGRTVVVGQEVTRPANTTAYTAKDAVGDNTVGTLSNVGRINGGSGYITALKITTDNETPTPRFRVWLYQTAPTATNDNAAFGILYANKAVRLGFIDLPALAAEDTTAGDCAETQNIEVRLPFVCDGASRDLRYVIETLDAFTPTSGQKFYVQIEAELN